MQINAERRKFYTWNDVEYYIQSKRQLWPEILLKVEVYSNEIIFYIKESSYEEEVLQFTKEMFGKNYNCESRCICLDVTSSKLKVYFEYAEDYIRRMNKPAPLFKEYLYVDENVEESVGKLPGVNVLAFHSYKGGVGRTLSAIAFAKELIEVHHGEKKLLIVDADIEAPGLTWLSQQENHESEISYLDILSIIQSKGVDDTVLENVSHVVEKSVLNFDTNTMSGNHYFLPTYRYKEQIMDIYANPERIMKGNSNKYIISDFLSLLGKKLGVDAVVVDLRAGISEYSAPFLFDYRVQKFLVTSTSFQSIYGTKMILEQMSKIRQNDHINVLLTKVPVNDFTDEMRNRIKEDIYVSMYQKVQRVNDDSEYDALDLTDFIIEIPVSDTLVHLGSLEDICSKLKRAESVSCKIREVLELVFPAESQGQNNQIRMETKRKYLESLHSLADSELTAEGCGASRMLTIKPLEAIGRDFKREVPQIVVLGTKGSGKTYLYKQMLFAKTWGNFLNEIDEESKFDNEVYIYPLLSTQNRSKLNPALRECSEYCTKNLNKLMTDEYDQTDVVQSIRETIRAEGDDRVWLSFWKNMILHTFKGKYESLAELDNLLYNQNKKIIYIIDGLEDIFGEISSNHTERIALKSLCTDFMNMIQDLQYRSIGIVIFLRKDIAELTIKTNLEQFKNQYSKYALSWTQKDALRLALWLADNACNNIIEKLYDNVIVPIKSAPSELVEEALYKLWGKKMGSDSSKTAFTARWVIASLSDFRGQLQARDIVRFLKFASEDPDLDEKRTVDDRYLTVAKMKEAVKKCSKEKLIEIKTEIKQLEPIFKKLSDDVEPDMKIVPLREEVVKILTNEEQETLKDYGYFLKSGEEYFIPECIRYALEYNKTKRGGIKIVSLLVQK